MMTLSRENQAFLKDIAAFLTGPMSSF